MDMSKNRSCERRHGQTGKEIESFSKEEARGKQLLVKMSKETEMRCCGSNHKTASVKSRSI